MRNAPAPAVWKGAERQIQWAARRPRSARRAQWRIVEGEVRTARRRCRLPAKWQGCGDPVAVGENFRLVMASASSRLRMPQRKVKSSLERRSHLVEGVIFKLINAKSDLIFGKDGLPSQLACETGSSNGGRADGPHNGPGWHDD